MQPVHLLEAIKLLGGQLSARYQSLSIQPNESETQILKKIADAKRCKEAGRAIYELQPICKNYENLIISLPKYQSLKCVSKRSLGRATYHLLGFAFPRGADKDAKSWMFHKSRDLSVYFYIGETFDRQS